MSLVFYKKHCSKYYHFGVAASLRNPNCRQEMLNHLYNEGGRGGFLNVMRAYEVNDNEAMCLVLFEHFLGFCEFMEI